jgi:hypothetical protein
MTGNICVYCPGGPDSDFEVRLVHYLNLCTNLSTTWTSSNQPLHIDVAVLLYCRIAV